MRIANNSFWSEWDSGKNRVALLALLGSFFLFATSAYAADPAALSAPSVPVAMQKPAALPVEMAATNPPDAVMPNAIGAGSSVVAPVKEGSALEKKATAMEEKVSDGVKSTIKNLDSSEGMTLSDLNTAKQTMARIDAMIEIEKRMIELEKLRNERGGSKPPSFATGLAGAIPASALAPLPQVSRPVFSESSNAPKEEHVAFPTEPSHYEILRIAGAEGKYSAVLKSPGGESKTVHVGDQLSNGSVIKWISASSVVIEGKDKEYAPS